MNAHLAVWGIIAILMSLSVVGFGHGALIDIYHIDDRIINPYDMGNFYPQPYSPIINPAPEPLFTHDLAVDVFRFEAPTGTQVGDFVTFIGTITNNGMISTPLNYAFFINGENLGPSVPQQASPYWDGVLTFLQPGESRMVIKSVQLTREGSNSIQLKADPFNLIRESRESNNARSIRIVVQPAVQPQPPEPQNNNPPADTPVDDPNNTNVPPQTNIPPQDNNQQNNNLNVTRADARDALEDAQRRCDAANTVLERAQRAIAGKESVSFSKRDVEREEDTFKGARREVRDADRAYDIGNYGESFTQAENAEDKCGRLIRKLRVNEPAPQPAPEPTPTYAVRYQQPSPSNTPSNARSVAVLEEEVQLIKSNVQKLVSNQPVEDDAASPWLLFGVIVGAFLVLGELATLAYFVFRK